MFSRLDPIFKSQIRHAETLDTRQGIRREEQAGGRPRGEEKPQDEQDRQVWEDETTVSIVALLSFLEQLTIDAADQHASAGSGEAHQKPQTPRPSPNPPAHAPEIPSRAAHAASAYQKTYRATHGDERIAAAPEAMPKIQLLPEEIRIIHQLINDLKKLGGRNINTLPLRKSGSFLQSLVDSVKQELQNRGL